MPGYFASKALASFSPTGRSIAEYMITLPSLVAASTSSGVIATGGGAAARAGEANTALSASAVVPFKTFRLENFLAIIVSSTLSPAQRAAAFRRQREPDLGTPGNGVFGRRHHPQGGAVRGLDHVVAAGAEKHLPRHGGLDRILGRRRRLRRQLDIVLADRNHGPLAGLELRADHLECCSGKRDVIGIARGAVDDVAGADEARDEFRLRPVVDVFGRAELVDLAGVHPRDQVGGGHRLRLVVGDVNGGVTILVVQPANFEALFLRQMGAV